MGEFVNLEVADNGVGTIRLDRPPVNALNAQLSMEIGEAVDAAAADENVGAVVVWGGEKVFAAGADIKEMADLSPVTMLEWITPFQDIFTRLERMPKVTIAAVTGYALGGGCELAMACDLRIAAENAVFGQPEILLGVIPGAGGTQRLTRLVGVGRAKELIYSGRNVPAPEALAIGLVNEVVAPDEVHNRATALAERYGSGPRVALRAAKQAIHSGLDTDIGNGLVVERQAFAGLFATDDQRIGMESFLEKGPGKADFTGR